MLPLMVAASLFATLLAIVITNSATLFAFSQRLQFEADQYALALAWHDGKTAEQIVLDSGLSSRLSSSSFRFVANGVDAQVWLCAIWQTPVKAIGLPAQSTVCVKSTAR
jgi:hypothetical protein